MQPATYQSVDADAGPPVGWGDGIFGCFNDMQVCLLGFFPLGCVQYLYAVRSSLDGRRKKEHPSAPLVPGDRRPLSYATERGDGQAGVSAGGQFRHIRSALSRPSSRLF